MSLRIIKPGLLDTVQDAGRRGYQHLGINPGGAMDPYSAQLANALLGLPLGAPVLELHFPAAQIMFGQTAIISITGGNFSPTINDKPVPMDHPIAVAEHSLLSFTHHEWGARVYVSVSSGLQVKPWLGSDGTNLKAAMGGHEGRALQRYDQLLFKNRVPLRLRAFDDFLMLPWKAMNVVDKRTHIEFLMGSEWGWLDEASRSLFEKSWYKITPAADRMGYRLSGRALKAVETEQLVSSGVCFGTVQLLPDGQLILLMADHQTTGGYPRIAQIISAHLPLLAQKTSSDLLQFKMTTLEAAQAKLLAQKKYLEQLQIACKLTMEQWLQKAKSPQRTDEAD